MVGPFEEVPRRTLPKKKIKKDIKINDYFVEDESYNLTRSMKAAKKKSTSFGLKSQGYSRSYQKTYDDSKKYSGYINYDQEV
jgi:hypothetical protein